MIDTDKLWQRVADHWRHRALLFMALFASGPANTVYEDHRYSRHQNLRRRAVYGRARAVVLFDRVLNNELRATVVM